MKIAFLAFLVSITVCFGGDFELAAYKQLRDFIQSLPPRENVVADVDLFQNGSTKESVRGAAERLTKAKDGFKHLKTLLLIGKSVFDYPGLLALARPRHLERDNKYSMTLGIPPGWNWNHEQGTNENEYEIIFDGRGIITELRPVIYKH